jgi:hypothetical protein
MNALYAVSFNFVPNDGLGYEVSDAPTQVRAFMITGHTYQSWIVEGGLKVRRKHMVLELNGFRAGVFQTVEAACRSVSTRSRPFAVEIAGQ